MKLPVVTGLICGLLQRNQSVRNFQIRNTITSLVMNPIKTFVFMDLETTGLPHLENNTTRITEFCAVAVQADHIELGCFPRVHNKLSLCFNPRKLISMESTEITGLSNDLLEHQSFFSSDTVDIINKWLQMNREPICLVAHNGNKFDYPILQAELAKTQNSLLDDLLCVDSLSAFRQIDSTSQRIEQEIPQLEVPFQAREDFKQFVGQAVDEYQHGLTPSQMQKLNETTPKKQMTSRIYGGISKIQKRDLGSSAKVLSYKLGDVYTRLTSKRPIAAHEAEGDVSMLITCAAVYGEKFVAYANENSVKLTNIPVMKPGRKVGT